MPLIKFLSHSYAKFLLKTWACLLGLFFILRCVFYFANHNPSLHTPLYADAFFVGFRFDTVIICYSLFIPFLLLSIASFIRSKTFLPDLVFIIICLELIPIELIICANIPYFKQLGSVISKNAFLWQDSPGMMTGLVFSSFSYWGYLILFALFYFISVYLIRGYFNQLKTDLTEFPQQNILFKILLFLSIGLVLVYGARGTTSQKTAIHQGFATISDDQFINSLGLNPCFVFFQSYLNEKENSVYVAPKNIDGYFANVKKYLGASNADPFSISRNYASLNPPTKQNLIIVLMESMCMYKMGYLKGKNISPNFSSIVKESVFFDRFYSSGTHTFNGLFSTETGLWKL